MRKHYYKIGVWLIKMKLRKKHILSRSRVGYKVVLDDDQEQVKKEDLL